MRRLAEDPSGPWSALRFVDAVEFAHDRLLPGLTVTAPLGSVALHHTCSSTQLGSNAAATAVAARIAAEVTVPVDWGCCGFAGGPRPAPPRADRLGHGARGRRGHPPDRATPRSVNRTCELGMSRATGQDYVHLLELLERATRSATGAGGWRLSRTGARRPLGSLLPLGAAQEGVHRARVGGGGVQGGDLGVVQVERRALGADPRDRVEVVPRRRAGRRPLQGAAPAPRVVTVDQRRRRQVFRRCTGTAASRRPAGTRRSWRSVQRGEAVPGR